jgi:ATP-dependent DNA helicase RecG
LANFDRCKTNDMNDWRWLVEQPEGQFLERKSAYDRSGGKTTPRPVKEALRDVAEALVAMANADGGTVVLGIEDDGTVSGVPPITTLNERSSS